MYCSTVNGKIPNITFISCSSQNMPFYLRYMQQNTQPLLTVHALTYRLSRSHYITSYNCSNHIDRKFFIHFSLCSCSLLNFNNPNHTKQTT